MIPSNPLSGGVFYRPTRWTESFCPKAERKEIRALDKQGLSQILGAVKETSLFPLFVTAASTGCRRGELLALEWQDIDFQNGMITISKSLEQTKSGLRIKSTKSGKVRRFPLPSVALGVLLQHHRNQPLENPIEPNRKTLAWSFVALKGTTTSLTT
jgi:integrase